MGTGKRVLYALLCVALLFSVTSIATAQQKGKIVGRVVDAGTNDPLIGTNIIVVDTKLGATTDLDGIFFILNVPPGEYDVEASMLGYNKVKFTGVRVSEGRTTNLNFRLDEMVMQAAEEVTYVAKRPLIAPDMTDSRTTRTSDDIQLMPVENIQEVIRLTPGAVGGNFRGGRATEVNYLVDGATFMDPMTGTYEGFLPQLAFEEVNVVTGGISAEYGNALSGVVSQVTKEGSERLNGSLLYRSNDAGSTFIGSRDQMKDMQASLSGPIPIIPDALGDLYFFATGQYFDTKGRFANDDSVLTSGFGKLTYKLNPQQKLTISGTVSNSNYTQYGHLWSRTTNEDRLYSFDGPEFVDQNGASWYGNGQVDTEDLNGNGRLDAGEDLDADDVIDSEDLNHNGRLDEFSMFDHLPFYFQHTNQFSAKWNQASSSRTFWELSVSRYETKMHYNTRERFNEDTNGNGMLDLEPSYGSIDDIPDDILNADRTYLRQTSGGSYWFDYNLNGDVDYEDLNGNEIWDWDEYGHDTDLFRDDNDNGYIDASENGDQEDWLSWNDIVFNSNSRDNDDYYLYGDGKTYNRARWNNDSKVTWTFRGSLTSQVHRYHQLKTGTELKFYEIMDHDVDMASGGNVYGQNFDAEPRLYGAWIEDKMEFEGLVLNLGVRADYFDINWQDYPADLTDPVVDPQSGGQVKDPVSIDPKAYWSPRLGVAFPITERDLLSFNYNRNFQIPILRYAFTNVNWDFSGAFPIIGNPNLEPERTTAYELTLRHQFSEDLVIVGTGFYKDISGLTDTRQVFYDARNWYGLYVNQDYGNVRGVELSLEKRFSNFYSGNISYTYSVAKGKSSTARQNYENAWANNLIRTTESYLDWDQRHTIYGNIQFMIPKGTRLFNTPALDEMTLSLIGRYGSGLPYSSPARDKDPPINDKRLPHTLSFDGRVQKRVSLNEHTGIYVYLQAYNIFDQENIDQRFFQTNADIGWYEQFDDVDGKYNDPRYYQRGRLYQFGVGIEF
ncbi:carboxypeptidase regulatory-like domain-containing protein [bacterium]|nr:carboxypeptidase regulatory-like domain-containing protein [bacterium]